ncbi:MAG TPA: hypothetical protein VFH43_09525 [Candidatus Kapabacteria bacterium]|nr:hypothetical protein [Candidatus Kapabacteria bacterium]
MLNLKKYSHFFLLAVLAVFVASCEKRDANLTTDFESKKASADKLVTEVNEGLARMEGEHASMMSDLDSAGKASKDSSRVNGVREDMNRHMEQASRVKALVDSVSVYKAITAENDEQMKAANDRLGTHFDDLSSEWKTLQDQHAKLQQDIQGFAVTAAGDAVVDSANAANNNGTGTGTGTATRPTPSKNSGGDVRNPTGTGTKRPEPAKNSGGAPRNSTSTSGGTTTTTTTTTTNNERPLPKKNSGGESRTSTSTTTTKP